MQQKLVQFFFTTISQSFWKLHRKETAKTTPETEKYVYYKYAENIFSARNPVQVVVFCKYVLILKNSGPKFSHFGSNILTTHAIMGRH